MQEQALWQEGEEEQQQHQQEEAEVLCPHHQLLVHPSFRIKPLHQVSTPSSRTSGMTKARPLTVFDDLCGASFRSVSLASWLSVLGSSTDLVKPLTTPPSPMFVPSRRTPSACTRLNSDNKTTN